MMLGKNYVHMIEYAQEGENMQKQKPVALNTVYPS